MIKNIFKFLAVSLFVIGVSSCAKEEIGGTAVQDMCGEWYVQVDYVDEDGNVVAEDPYGYGYFELYTYNTNANLSTEMYLDDSSFYPFRVIVDVNYGSKTFSATDAIDDYYDAPYNIKNGSIVKDGAVSPAGYTADSISFILVDTYYDEDEEGYVTDYWWYHGYRRTGLNGGYD